MFFIFIGVVYSQCVEQSYFILSDTEQMTDEISIRLEGEYVIGYGDDFVIEDKSKIQLNDIENNQQYTYGPSNFEVFCPAIHNDINDQTMCEIMVNMYKMNTTEDETLALAQLVIPVEINNDIRENPTLQITTIFQLRLVDLAEQLQEMSFYREYTNCDKRIYILSGSLPITTAQMKTLQNYSRSLDSTAITTNITDIQKGKIIVLNYTTDKRSYIHLFALFTIIAGVILLAAIHAFKKQQQNDEKQPLQQEMQTFS